MSRFKKGLELKRGMNGSFQSTEMNDNKNSGLCFRKYMGVISSTEVVCNIMLLLYCILFEMFHNTYIFFIPKAREEEMTAKVMD